MTDTALRTYTVARLDTANVLEEKAVEAETIFDAPKAYVQAEFGKYAALTTNLRQGELVITGDRRRWFLHQIVISIGSELFERFIIVTAD